MFPVIFPLFLVPRTGTSALKGYFTGFFYLAAWGPLYVVLHMFIMDRAADSLNAASPGGITMAGMAGIDAVNADTATIARSEEHTSELQSLMRISYAVFCLKKKTQMQNNEPSLSLSKIL